MSSSFRLNADFVLEITQGIHDDIAEYFPKRRLFETSKRVLALVKEAASAPRLARPNWWLRAVIFIGMIVLVMAAAWGVQSLHLSMKVNGMSDLVQIVASIVAVGVVLPSLTIGLLRLDTRFSHSRAFKKLHELRSLAGIIDMHATDNIRCWEQAKEKVPKKMPKRPPLTDELLVRYLESCRGLLSMLGKVAAMYGEYFTTDVLLGTVREVENVTLAVRESIGQALDMMAEARMHEADIEARIESALLHLIGNIAAAFGENMTQAALQKALEQGAPLGISESTWHRIARLALAGLRQSPPKTAV